MNLSEKLAYAKTHIEAIMRHDDEDLLVRAAAANALTAHIGAEIEAANARAQARVDTLGL
jgi:hypothetical protein